MPWIACRSAPSIFIFRRSIRSTFKLSRKRVDSAGRYLDPVTVRFEHGVTEVVIEIGDRDRAVSGRR